MKWIALATMCLVAATGCSTTSRSPDAIRQETANATTAAAQDAKAVAQGVFEGLKTKGPLDLNTASKGDLETLPGMDGPAADRIVAGRPYQSSAELLRRHIVSKAEYDRIASRVETR